VRPGIGVSPAVAFSVTNDANTANTALEVRASKTTFTTGDVCTTVGGVERWLGTGCAGTTGDSYVICPSSYRNLSTVSSWNCTRYVDAQSNPWGYPFVFWMNCDPGYVFSGHHQSNNGAVYYIDAIKCTHI
jgi:hypothetical protein